MDKNIEIKQDTILKTRQWFIDNCNDCISEAKNGVFHVNDLDGYIYSNMKEIEEYRSGKYDNHLGFIQKAIHIQEGVSLPIMGF